MHQVVRAPKDFWLGVVYLSLGAAGLWFGLGYPLGTASRMGPGYMPSLISGLLVVFGIASLARSIRLDGESIGRIALAPVCWVIGGVLAFALLVERAGLVVAIFALVLMSAAASSEFRFQWPAALGLVAFVAACCLVFVKGLGVQLPLFGSWFGV